MNLSKHESKHLCCDVDLATSAILYRHDIKRPATETSIIVGALSTRARCWIWILSHIRHDGSNVDRKKAKMSPWRGKVARFRYPAGVWKRSHKNEIRVIRPRAETRDLKLLGCGVDSLKARTKFLEGWHPAEEAWLLLSILIPKRRVCCQWWWSLSPSIPSPFHPLELNVERWKTTGRVYSVSPLWPVQQSLWLWWKESNCWLFVGSFPKSLVQVYRPYISGARYNLSSLQDAPGCAEGGWRLSAKVISGCKRKIVSWDSHSLIWLVIGDFEAKQTVYRRKMAGIEPDRECWLVKLNGERGENYSLPDIVKWQEQRSRIRNWKMLFWWVKE